VKKQLLLAGGAIALVLALFFWDTGRQNSKYTSWNASQGDGTRLSIEQFIAAVAKKQLSPTQAIALSKPENNIYPG
jgi:hypothetical protein